MTEAAPETVQMDVRTVRALLEEQFPALAGLELNPLPSVGTDNHIFRLGPRLCVRLPKVDWAARTAQREAALLPRFSGLPLRVPQVFGLGMPGSDYPWHWSVLEWIEGDAVEPGIVPTPERSAELLASFILGVREIAPDPAFQWGEANHFRGAPLVERDVPFRAALTDLADEVDVTAAERLWEVCLDAAEPDASPVWLHGDLHGGNLLKRDGRLVAAIDWGLAGIGDGACDLSAGWALFEAPARERFRRSVEATEAEWLRGAGWALSIACIALAYYRRTNSQLGDMSRRTIARLLADFA